MNYEKRFKRFTADLLALIEKHMLEWEEAEKGGYDIDEIMDRVSSDEPSAPVVYSKSEFKNKDKKIPKAVESI